MSEARAAYRRLYDIKMKLALDEIGAMEALDRGGLVVITGCMCSSKTRFYLDLLFELTESVNEREFEELLFKPEQDTRYGSDIGTYGGVRKHAHIIKEGKDTLKELKETVGEKVLKDARIIAFEESELFQKENFPILCEQLVRLGKLVIVIGLNLNWRGEPFGPMSTLMARADVVVKLFAECPVCRRLATHTTHSDAKGKPVKPDSPVVEIGIVGGSYGCVCRSCYLKERILAGREIPLL